ncbi:T9SS C-terminal target domain-containing protein [Paraflavitalea soli]|uniref:T9SS C-terminal target domain-containing protein n=1 Tax=Paraflavitalea soli TaxID=2315862 RepID=A0A3B7MR13_9BACT|nr:T9SS type A sorting domain-containing protein [Paraflavitalea soli]AXY76932.1 T9SS C-terminal target domain-containing protein [Paraflavitalea soli]
MPLRLPAIAQKAICFFALLSIGCSTWSQCTPVNLEKITLPSNEWIGNGYIKGLLRFLPADYAANPSKKYPVIIYFHGRSAAGDGSQDALCNILGDGATALPGKIESNEFPTTVTVNGQTYSYIVLMPQYAEYSEPPYYADKIEAFIDYAMSAYRIDPARVYLTGMSSGANHVIDYVSSSTSRAQRIAAVSMSSMCWKLSLNPAGPANIANAGLPTWFVHCVLDNPCVVAWPDEWVNAINNQPGAVAPRYSRLEETPDPQPFPFPLSQQLLYCRPFPHDTWLALYSPLFTPAGGPNLANWFLQYSRTTLPVRLKNFTARLTAGKVALQWTTTSETDNASFTIERAGSDGRFTSLATVKGSGNAGVDKQYDYSDEKPLPQLSYYRLVQTDIDGDKQYLGTKTVVNRQGLRQLIIPAANPFINNIVAYINVDKTMKVIVEVTDISGRKIAGLTGMYAPGATEINLPAAQLSKGIYYLRAQSGSITDTYKIIKQ